MKKTNYPSGWDEKRVRRVLEHYETQSDEEAVAEDEAALPVGCVHVSHEATRLLSSRPCVGYYPKPGYGREVTWFLA